MPTQAVPRYYPGVVNCLRSMSFGKVHGPNAAVAKVSFDGSPAGVQLGSIKSLRVGNSFFSGYVIRNEYDKVNDITTITMADWRDVLHDHWIFGAFNVQEQNGEIWHIFPQDWAEQTKRVVTKELDQLDFVQLNNERNFNALKSASEYRLLSAAEMLNIIAKNPIQFSWSAEPLAYDIIRRSRPMNIDFQSGMKIIDIINKITSDCGLQFTVMISGELYITLKGYTNSFIVNGILNNTIPLCTLDPDQYTLGEEISEAGRRVNIVGTRNRKQYIFMCKPDWNLNWTHDFCFGFLVDNLLQQNGLPPRNTCKLKDMPFQYQDDRYWHEKQEYAGAGHVVAQRTRNDLTVAEYLDKVVYRTYVIDFDHVVLGATYGDINNVDVRYVVFDKSIPQHVHQSIVNSMDEQYIMTEATTNQSLCPFPPSDKLVTDSNMQAIPIKTFRKIVNGIRNPGTDQLTLTPTNDGFTIDVEDRMANVRLLERDEKGALTGRTYVKKMLAYSVRIIFNEIQFYEKRPLLTRTPDYVLCVLSLDTSVYTFNKGWLSNFPRVRTQKIDVPNLHRTYVNDVEVRTIADNLRMEQQKGGAIPAVIPVNADIIAEQIANQALFHLAINKSGNLVFSRPMGFECDGLIDSVQLQLGENSFTETVNLNTGWLDGMPDRSDPIELGISAKMKFDKKIALDRLNELRRLALAGGRARAQAHANANTLFQMPASVFNPAATARAFSGGAAAQGTARARAKKAHILRTTAGLSISQLLIYGKIKELSGVDDS